MSDSALVAVIAGIFTLAGVSISGVFTMSSRKTEIEQLTTREEIHRLFDTIEMLQEFRKDHQERLEKLEKEHHRRR